MYKKLIIKYILPLQYFIKLAVVHNCTSIQLLSVVKIKNRYEK